MGGAQSDISFSDEWKAESNAACMRCGVAVDGLRWATHLFQNDPDRKCYLLYDKAHSRQTITVGSSMEGSVGGGPDGPSGSIGGSVSQSVTTNVGDYMVKMLRKDYESYRCVGCFYKVHPTLLKSIAITCKGKAWLINSDMTLSPAQYGDIAGW